MNRITRALVMALAVAIIVPSVATAHWPVVNRTSYVSQWMTTRHKAIDIASARGSTIVPIRAGRVIFAGWRNNCGGYQVWVSHGSGLYSAYYHMSKHVSWKGRSVAATTRIGYVGTTGCSTGNHLHIEVWKGWPWARGSVRVNPWGYINHGIYLPARYR